MSFLTDLGPSDRIELKIGDSVIRLKVIKRTGWKVRLSIDAEPDVTIKKIMVVKDKKTSNGQ